MPIAVSPSLRRQGLSGIDGGLAGDMQVFDAPSLSEFEPNESLSKFEFEFLWIVLSARLCFNLCPCLDGTQFTRSAIAVRKEPNLHFVNCLMEGEILMLTGQV